MGRRLRPDETDSSWDGAAGSSPGMKSTWQQLPISGIEGLRDAVLGAGLDAVQMSRGRMAGSLAFLEADGILYGSGSIDGRVSLVGSLSEKRVTVGIGLAFPGGARHWHRDVPTGGVGIFLAGDEHDARYSRGACYATATLTEERLQEEAARRDLVLDRRTLGGTRIHARPTPEAVVQALHRRVVAVHAGSGGDLCHVHRETSPRRPPGASLPVLGPSPSLDPPLPLQACGRGRIDRACPAPSHLHAITAILRTPNRDGYRRCRDRASLQAVTRAVEEMAGRRTNKIGFEATPPTVVAEAEARADEAVLRLARLIGRQMAREQVARARAAEGRAERKRAAE